MPEGKQIDWSDAPEGATHYLPGACGFNACWYIVQEDRMAVMCCDQKDEWLWRSIDGNDRMILIPRAIPRPVEPATWTGSGLPPVGTACEVDYCEEWHRCEIIAHFQQRCGMVAAFTVGADGEAKSLDAFGEPAFRPIRTPEQIAAEERLHSIRSACTRIARTLDDLRGSTKAERAALRVIEAMIDAGYSLTNEES